MCFGATSSKSPFIICGHVSVLRAHLVLHVKTANKKYFERDCVCYFVLFNMKLHNVILRYVFTSQDVVILLLYLTYCGTVVIVQGGLLSRC